ncbi:MAG: hypothetical protein HYY06_17140 [Deltaproteobacteria bacterium]|nr:hypothetical protein [Deltaproteobacteria bacterium]
MNLRQRLFNAVRQGARLRLFAILGALLVVVVVVVVPAMPRETRISFRLPPDVRSLEVEYWRSDDLVRSARFTWDGKSPDLLRHTPELVAGPMEVEARVRDRAGQTWTIRRRIEIDPDRIVRVDLRP